MINDVLPGTHGARPHRPDRRRQRPGHLPVPDRQQLPRRGVRPDRLPGHRPTASDVYLRTTLAQPGADVRHGRSARSCSTSTCTIRRPPATSTAAAFPTATTRSLRPTPGASGSRSRASRRRCGSTRPAAGRHRAVVVAEQADRDDHDRAAGVAQFGTPASGWTFTVALTGQDGFSADQARASPLPRQASRSASARRAGPSRSARSTPAPCRRRWTPSRRPALPRPPSSTRPRVPALI